MQRVMKLPHIVDFSTAADNAANAGDHEDYAALRAARREAIGKALNKDFCDNMSKLTPTDSSVWRLLRKWRNPSAGNTLAPLIVNGVEVTGAKEKSCALAEFYAEASLGKPRAKRVRVSKVQRESFRNVTDFEVQNAINRLQSGRPGPDELHPEFFKHLGVEAFGLLRG